MFDELLKEAVQQGIWTVMSVSLLLYVLKENAKRETKYQEVISELTKYFGILEDIKTDVKEMKDKVFK